MIETSYFQWLCEMVHADSMEKSYYILCGELFKYPFRVKAKMDINRNNDGLELAKDFFSENEEAYNEYYLYYNPNTDLLKRECCSMLELFISIAKHMNDELMTEDSSDKTHKYFWEIIKNLELDEFDDERFGEETSVSTVQIRDILVNLNERRYKKDGSGGMFPLKCPEKDQRKIEIWYQMQAYINEKYKIMEE